MVETQACVNEGEERIKGGIHVEWLCRSKLVKLNR
jgi:hypothetical protein